MLTEERYRIILERLQQRGVVKLQELVELLEASESTVRRDLIDLEERQLLKRIHGGAALPSPKIQEPGIEEKRSKTFNRKTRLPGWLQHRLRMEKAFTWMRVRPR